MDRSIFTMVRDLTGKQKEKKNLTYWIWPTSRWNDTLTIYNALFLCYHQFEKLLPFQLSKNSRSWNGVVAALNQRWLKGWDSHLLWCLQTIKSNLTLLPLRLERKEKWEIRACGRTNSERIGCEGSRANPSSSAWFCRHPSGLYRFEILFANEPAGKTVDSQGTPLMKSASPHHYGTWTSAWFPYRPGQSLTQDQGGDKQQLGTLPLPTFPTIASLPIDRCFEVCNIADMSNQKNAQDQAIFENYVSILRGNK